MSTEPAKSSVADPLDPLRWEKLVALQRAVGRNDFLRALVLIFLRDAPLRLSGIREAAACGDKKTAEQTAHSLKGSAGNVGATIVATLSSEVEQSAGRGDFEKVAELLPRLEAEVQRAETALLERSDPDRA